MEHRLTPVQKRILAFMWESEQPVVFQTGYKATEFVNGFIVRCQSFVPYFLKHHGYIHQPNKGTSRWELTAKGCDAIGGCSQSPTRSHVVQTQGTCVFCKRKVARSLK